MTFWIIGSIVFGWLLADFIGGLFHWFEDRVARRDWPVLGDWVVKPNRLHHEKPLDFLNGSLLKRNLAVWVITAAILVATFLVTGSVPLWLAVAAVGGAMSNEVHGWAHLPQSAPGLVRLLQETGLLQAPIHHSKHHRDDHDVSYCVLTNILNPFLNRLGFWNWLENMLTAVGLEPNRGEA